MLTEEPCEPVGAAGMGYPRLGLENLMPSLSINPAPRSSAP
jgi:hypothetical protein